LIGRSVIRRRIRVRKRALVVVVHSLNQALARAL
jgi:hypothetical protein